MCDPCSKLAFAEWLPAGRGADVFISANHCQSFSRCRMLGSPMVRYDGVVTACCNESVIMGQGPARLRQRCRSGAEVGEMVDAMRADPWLEAIGGAGPGALTLLPKYVDLQRRRFASVCDLFMLENPRQCRRRSSGGPADRGFQCRRRRERGQQGVGSGWEPGMTGTGSGTGAADRLRAKVALAYPAVRSQAERVWTSPQVRQLYPRYLVTMHGITRSAVPLLEAAADRCRALATEDEVAARLAPYFAHHAVEERGHDGWVVEDIEAAGGDPGEPLSVMPSAAVATLVGASTTGCASTTP